MNKQEIDDRSVPDPERWSDRARGGSGIEGLIGGVLGRTRDATASGGAMWAPRSVRAGDGRSRWARPALVWRLAVAAAALLGTGGVVVAARLALAPPRRAQQTVTVPAAATVTVQGPHRRRLTIAGPARLEIEPGAAERADLAVAGGLLTVEAGEAALSVEAEAGLVLIPRGAAGEIDGRAGAAPEIRALAGELRVTLRAGGETLVRPLPPAAPAALPAAPAAPTLAPPPSARAAEAPPADPAIAPLVPAARDDDSARRPTKRRRKLAARTLARAPTLTAPPPYESPAPEVRATAAAGEGEILVLAFQALRARHDPAAALVALDDYQRRFPDGTLRAEARLARAEALLALRRSSQALALLMNSDGEAGGATLTRDVRAVRGELLAAAGRCGEALADFDQVLASSGVADQAGARALYGRASCRLRAGDRTGARLDLERYRSRYPSGDLVEAVRSALDALDAR